MTTQICNGQTDGGGVGANGRAARVIVGIAGGTASGKSWLADFLRRDLGGDAVVISQDWYYKDRRGQTDQNFDHPDAFDTALLNSHLAALRRGEAIQAPRYDYATHTRLPARRLAPAPVVLLEGILVLHDPEMRRHLDHRIFVDAPAALRLERRLRRDTAERGLSHAESWRLYERFARPMHARFVEPSAASAGHVWRPADEPAFPAKLATLLRDLL